jgi:hypothetical protein
MNFGNVGNVSDGATDHLPFAQPSLRLSIAVLAGASDAGDHGVLMTNQERRPTRGLYCNDGT